MTDRATDASSCFGEVTTKGFRLLPWQVKAVEAWVDGEEGTGYRGTIEVFTGGGKTLIALECFRQATTQAANLRLAVVVPTEALARQWTDFVTRHTEVSPNLIGLLGAGSDDSFDGHRVLICVLNTAAQRLPELAAAGQPLMLVVDECHRAGAPGFSRVLSTTAGFRLGLSATPDREELDDNGDPLSYDEQLVGRSLGRVVYRFSLREARDIGWLPEYEIHHHGVRLDEVERRRYDEESRRIDDIAERLADLGIDQIQARRASSRSDEVGGVARAYVAATAKRKDILYRAAERARVTSRILAELIARKPRARVIMFHERVDEAANLFERLRIELPTVTMGLEHSRISTAERTAGLENFRTGRTQVLVSVKSLIEGIDVPDADVGISVASSTSVRQRVQSLGRVLRRSFEEGAPEKTAEMHVLYVAETVDELIYGREDWSDLTGQGSNNYWLWPLSPETEPERRNGPPRRPRPTEEQEWERLGSSVPDPPVPWHGVVPIYEYSVDTQGTVTTVGGALVANPQGAADMMKAVRGRPGGRFFVTPVHRLVLIRGEGTDSSLLVAGRLAESFVVRELGPGAGLPLAEMDIGNLAPGVRYPGPTDKTWGSFKLGRKRGGVIERRVRGRSTEFALLQGSESLELEANARRALAAWRTVSTTGLTFHVNSLWHAWYLVAGEPRFLAEVPGGFAWPTDRS
jgi:superfamily II DNA or RNA helicase